jgi:hypothetical protein
MRLFGWHCVNGCAHDDQGYDLDVYHHDTDHHHHSPHYCYKQAGAIVHVNASYENNDQENNQEKNHEENYEEEEDHNNKSTDYDDNPQSSCLKGILPEFRRLQQSSVYKRTAVRCYDRARLELLLRRAGHTQGLSAREAGPVCAEDVRTERRRLLL